MKKYDLQLRGYRIFLTVILLIGFITVESGNLWSQAPNRPQVPILSLTASRSSYDRDWYPDGRYWIPISQPSEAREFLMPVFIENQWFHYQSTTKSNIYNPEPIYSFEFKVLFDSLAVRPIGIQKFHPFPDSNDNRARRNVYGEDLYYQPFAKDWNITWSEYQDSSYQLTLNPTTAPQVRGRGRAMKIAGNYTQPLANTDTINEQFVVLFYIKFRLLQYKNAFNKVAGNEPIYIATHYNDKYGATHIDTIRYNDWIITKDAPFKKWRDYPGAAFVAADYPDPTKYTGIGGIDNSTLSNYIIEGTLPGMIYLPMEELIPDFGNRLERSIGSHPAITDLTNELWAMVDPITVDSARFVRANVGGADQAITFGSRNFRLLNSVSRTRMEHIFVQSDAPWLQFRINSTDRGKYTPVNKDTTRGYIKWLDEIMGCTTPSDCWKDPELRNTSQDADVFIEIRCKPDKIIDSPYGNYGGEKAGVYVGYLTFRSEWADKSTVRMRVTFINFRDPFEPALYEENGLYDPNPIRNSRGILLTLRNHSSVSPALTRIEFGTGHRATDNVDSLFGEVMATTPLGSYKSLTNQFQARWYIPDITERGLNAPLGFGDLFPNDEQQQTGVIMNPNTASADTIVGTGSRDIRNINDTAQSIIYLCKYISDSPITIEWDTQDFPADASLFISDTANGSLFPSVDMRNATYLGGTSYSFYIDDPNVTSFKIEYTLPKIIRYRSADGSLGIKKGWNFLSMPVRPRNNNWNIFFKKAMNVPYYYSHEGGYQYREQVFPGIGYFIKYSDNVDSAFTGILLARITKDVVDANHPTEDAFSDKVPIYPGWNTIGALSWPLNVNKIDFDEHTLYPGEVPDKNYVKKFGIWGYNTDQGYEEVSILEPARGYWIKSDKHGYLKLIYQNQLNRNGSYEPMPNSEVLAQSTMLTIRDNAQHEGKVFMHPDRNLDLTGYEMPPLPPEGLFDVRFINNIYVDNSKTSVISLQGVTYPVSININNADANYTFYDAATDTKLGQIQRGANGNIEIKRTTTNNIKVLKNNDVFENSFNNFPNPVVNASTINYTITDDNNVTIKLYDAIGNEVSTLVNEYLTAGQHTAKLNASNLTSGRYICKLVAGNHTDILTISVVK